MKRATLLHELALAGAATFIACTFTAACHSNDHPDDKQAVYSTLTSHDLATVMVAQDRDKGVIKLTGIVASADRKDTAQQLASQAAPGYTIDNQIQVEQTDLMKAPVTDDQAPIAGNRASNDSAKPAHHRK